MKKYIIILLTALAFSSCLKEGDDGCPADMTLSFELVDQYETVGDFDSRIGNDVLLYMFRDGKYFTSLTIPYEEIRDDGKYTFRKPAGMEGELDLLAWAVSSSKGDPASLPSWNENSRLEDLYLELKSRSGGTGNEPMACELYNGITRTTENIDAASSHNISLGHTACRVEVNVSGNPGMITSNNPNVLVSGSMTRMDMNLAGTGNEAVVFAPLQAGAQQGEYATGRFGILPSKTGQTVAVDIYDDSEILATLKVPQDNLPRGARSGDLMIFDYELGSNDFYITVNGFKQRIVIIKDM